MSQFLAGAAMMGYLVAGMFFCRFWVRTRDRLFVLFGVAFWILAVERLVLAVVHETSESRPYVYLIRFAAFLVIIFAILQKNLKNNP